MANTKESAKASSGGVGAKCEYKIYQKRVKKDGTKQVVTVDTLQDFNFDDGERDGPYALVVKQYFNEKQQLEKTRLVVRSPFLQKAFRDVVQSYPTVASDFTRPFELQSPFQVLFHYWEDFEEYRTATADDDVRMHLNLLFEFMKVEFGPSRDRVLAMLEKQQISFKTAWTIFRPGDILYTSMDGHPWLLVCEKTAYEESAVKGPYMEVHCSYTDFDGTLTGTAHHQVILWQKMSFGGDNPANIVELPIFPRKFVDQTEDELEGRLKKRGERSLELRGTKTVYYDGIAKYLKEPPSHFYHEDLESRGGIWLPYAETGRVVLDRKTFKEDFYQEQVNVRVPGEPVETLYCPPYVSGYSPNRKCWCQFAVDNISEIDWNPHAWDSLILEEEQKLVLRALVSSHIYPDSARDSMQQKGKGLVILLHGSPGSGKTLTAECAAEASQRALISSTMGELNSDNIPYYFELELKRLLQYATTWKAVVLLDEADVFLETRDAVGGNAERNALVAVFLKHLEFFSGIIFLTTNRIECFDPAMKSRIHLALGYSAPDIETRRHLWLQHLSKIPADAIDMDPEEDVDEFLREKLNGREIAYAINTARTIARFEKQPLRVEHMQKVLKVRHDFERSLQRTAKKIASLPPAVSGTSMNVVRQNSILTDNAAEYKS